MQRIILKKLEHSNLMQIFAAIIICVLISLMAIQIICNCFSRKNKSKNKGFRLLFIIFSIITIIIIYKEFIGLSIFELYCEEDVVIEKLIKDPEPPSTFQVASNITQPNTSEIEIKENVQNKQEYEYSIMEDFYASEAEVNEKSGGIVQINDTEDKSKITCKEQPIVEESDLTQSKLINEEAENAKITSSSTFENTKVENKEYNKINRKMQALLLNPEKEEHYPKHDQIKLQKGQKYSLSNISQEKEEPKIVNSENKLTNLLNNKNKKIMQRKFEIIIKK